MRTFGKTSLYLILSTLPSSECWFCPRAGSLGYNKMLIKMQGARIKTPRGCEGFFIRFLGRRVYDNSISFKRLCLNQIRGTSRKTSPA